MPFYFGRIVLTICLLVPPFIGAAQSAEEVKGAAGITARIVKRHEAYRDSKYIKVDVLLSNATDRKVFILKEPWSGGVWVDKDNHRIVIAHSAFSRERELALRGGMTLREIYRPEFDEVPAHETLRTEWNLGKRHGRGDWKLEGEISVLTDMSPLVGKEAGDVIDLMAASDLRIPCVGTTIVVK